MSVRDVPGPLGLPLACAPAGCKRPSSGIIHGNLNPSKILVKELNSIPTMLKVTAFSSRTSKNSLYFAPEQYNNNQNFEISTAVDIWALGAMFYEMVNDNIIDIDMKTIPWNQIKFRNPEFNNKEDLEMLKSMIEMDSTNRISASDLNERMASSK
uniref:Protein kinase domain-containing protein n=1 Tax=Panagrolaimus sp. PS1159 TaxID=55785 RepID=A0AC35FJF2_9BILA